MKYNLTNIRREYTGKPLAKKDVHNDPFRQIKLWLDEAMKAETMESTAMTLSTANKKGNVTSRTVLLKELKAKGLVFYTNYNSHKANDLKENPRVSALFYWSELVRQVRVEGITEKVAEEDSDRYFNSRPHSSKITAWISDQSSEIPDRNYLEQKQAELEQKFRDKKIERPPFWGGYIIKPDRFEFWQGRESRLHDRIEYLYENDEWKIRRLAP